MFSIERRSFYCTNLAYNIFPRNNGRYGARRRSPRVRLQRNCWCLHFSIDSRSVERRKTGNHPAYEKRVLCTASRGATFDLGQEVCSSPNDWPHTLNVSITLTNRATITIMYWLLLQNMYWRVINQRAIPYLKYHFYACTYFQLYVEYMTYFFVLPQITALISGRFFVLCMVQYFLDAYQ